MNNLNNMGYLTSVKEKTTCSVLVLPAWWGLNSFFRNFSDRLAEEGFTTLGFDLFHGKIASTIPEAKKLRGTLNQTAIREEIISAAKNLYQSTGSQVYAVGFSLGAWLGMTVLKEYPDLFAGFIGFYGMRLIDFSKTDCAFQFHFAEKDPYESASGVKKLQSFLKKSEKHAEVFQYPGTGHWFFESDRPDAYHKPSADLAWQRAIQFLNTNKIGA